MRRRIDIADIPAHCLPPGERARKPRAKRTKFHNVHVTVDAITFPSKRQAKHYQELKLRVATGELAGFIPEVSIPIGGGKRMRVDALLIPAGTKLYFEDPKGIATREWLLKKAIAESLYPIEIKTV